MGCDIHLYVEYKRKGNDNWSGFGKRIWMSRIYGLFAKLADVRNSWGTIPLSQPRGVPDDIASEAFEDYTRYISESNYENWVTKEKAKSWVDKGYSEYKRGESFVTDPDAHSGSYCSADELEMCIKEVWKDGFNGNEIQYVAVVDLLRSFERQECEARCVFWFDN